MNKTYAFNTGNHYTAHGQRIGIVELDNGALYFCDFDRNIDGYVSPDFFRREAPRYRVEQAYLMSGWTYWMGSGDFMLDRTLYDEARAVALTAPSKKAA